MPRPSGRSSSTTPTVGLRPSLTPPRCPKPSSALPPVAGRERRSGQPDWRRRSRTSRASAFDFQVSILYPYLKGLNRFAGRSPKHLSTFYVKLRAVARADHGALVQVSLRQRALLVGAGVAEGVKCAPDLRHSYCGSLHVEGPHATLFEIFRSP